MAWIAQFLSAAPRHDWHIECVMNLGMTVMFATLAASVHTYIEGTIELLLLKGDGSSSVLLFHILVNILAWFDEFHTIFDTIFLVDLMFIAVFTCLRKSKQLITFSLIAYPAHTFIIQNCLRYSQLIQPNHCQRWRQINFINGNDFYDFGYQIVHVLVPIDGEMCTLVVSEF